MPNKSFVGRRFKLVTYYKTVKIKTQWTRPLDL